MIKISKTLNNLYCTIDDNLSTVALYIGNEKIGFGEISYYSFTFYEKVIINNIHVYNDEAVKRLNEEIKKK